MNDEGRPGEGGVTPFSGGATPRALPHAPITRGDPGQRHPLPCPRPAFRRRMAAVKAIPHHGNRDDPAKEQGLREKSRLGMNRFSTTLLKETFRSLRRMWTRRFAACRVGESPRRPVDSRFLPRLEPGSQRPPCSSRARSVPKTSPQPSPTRGQQTYALAQHKPPQTTVKNLGDSP